MKKIFFISSLILVTFLAKAQYPQNPKTGNSSTLTEALGSYGGRIGYVFTASFGDTTAANASFIKNVPGQLIRVGDSLWLRSNDISHWIKQGASGGGAISAANNGLSLSGSTIQWGGNLIQQTDIGLQGFPLIIQDATNNTKLDFGDINGPGSILMVAGHDIATGHGSDMTLDAGIYFGSGDLNGGSVNIHSEPALGAGIPGNINLQVEGGGDAKVEFQLVPGRFLVTDNSTDYLNIDAITSVGTIQTNEFRIKDGSLGAASNGYVWTLTDQTTGKGEWVAGSGGAQGILANALINNNFDTLLARSISNHGISTKYFAFGNSITQGAAASPIDSAYPNRTAVYLGLPLTNYALASTGTGYSIGVMMQAINPGHSTTTSMSAGLNDLRATVMTGLAGRKMLNQIANSYKSFFANQYLKWYVEAGSGSPLIHKFGTWSNAYSPSTVRGKSDLGLYTQTINDSVWFEITGESRAAVGLIGADSGSNQYARGRIILYEPATGIVHTDTTFTENNQWSGVAVFGSDNQRGPMAFTFEGLNPAKTYRLKLISLQSTNIFAIDYFGALVEPASGMQCIFLTPPYLTSGGYATPPTHAGLGNATVDSVAAIIDSVYQAIKGSYPLYIVQINNYYNLVTGCSGDGIHPNNTGHRQWFNGIVANLPAVVNLPSNNSIFAVGSDLYFNSAGIATKLNNFGVAGTGITDSTDLAVHYFNNNLSTGVGGGQSAYGGILSGDDLTLHSSRTLDGTIFFGAGGAFDEANKRWALGSTTVSSARLFIQGNTSILSDDLLQLFTQTSQTGNILKVFNPSVVIMKQILSTGAEMIGSGDWNAAYPMAATYFFRNGGRQFERNWNGSTYEPSVKEASTWTFNNNGSTSLSANTSGTWFMPLAPTITDTTGYYFTVMKGSDGQISKIHFPFLGGTNIYNSDGTVSGDRTVTIGANDLDFTGNSTELKLDELNSRILISSSNSIQLIATGFISMTNPATSNDTTNRKILVYNTATNHIEKANWGNSIQTLQSVITASPVLTNAAYNNIDVNSGSLQIGESASLGAGKGIIIDMANDNIAIMGTSGAQHLQIRTGGITTGQVTLQNGTVTPKGMKIWTADSIIIGQLSTYNKVRMKLAADSIFIKNLPSIGAAAQSNIMIIDTLNWQIRSIPQSAFGTGTVTSFTATDGNGFDFTVTNPTTTPTLTATTTVSNTQLFYSVSGAMTGDAAIIRTGAGSISTTNVTATSSVTYGTGGRIATNGDLAGVGEIPASRLYSGTSSTNISFAPSGNAGTAGVTAGFYGYTGSAWKSVIEYANGSSLDLLLNKSAFGKVGVQTTTPTSSFHIGGSFAEKYTATATGITLDGTHCVINVTATGQTITLPTAASITGRIYTIKLTASGTGTVATTSSQTIDGSTTYSLSAQNKYVSVMSDGANWIIIANN